VNAAAGAVPLAALVAPMGGEGSFLERLARVLSLADHNTRVVLLGVTLLGAACGIIGSFLLMRKRSLLGDAVSHATLPGIAIAFLVGTALGGQGKALAPLLLGAFVAGVAGMGLVLFLDRATRLKQDAALGIVLSVFFGLGVALLGIVQQTSGGHQAGLESFIYGKTASMLTSDAAVIAVAAGAITLACVALFKEFALVCFDPDFAGARGFPVTWLDTGMMGLVVAVTVIGLQAVGLILIIALLVIPPAAARFHTERLPRMVLLAAALGAASGLLGAATSGLAPRLPAGALVVLVASGVFTLSLLFGTARGIVPRLVERRRLRRSVARQHLLRALYEWLEEHGLASAQADPAGAGVPFEHLVRARSWNERVLHRVLRRAGREGLVYVRPGGSVALTREGLAEARRVVRNHRLWEMYLITHADVAPSQVDRGADRIEHVLGRALVERLEKLLESRYPHRLPPTPHPLGEARAGDAREPAR